MYHPAGAGIPVLIFLHYGEINLSFQRTEQHGLLTHKPQDSMLASLPTTFELKTWT